MTAHEDRDRVRTRLLETEREVPTSRLTRLARTGRGALDLARTTLLRGGLDRADPAAVVRLVERLGELRGIAMKAGQILGYADASLPDEVRSILSLLHTSAPASPLAAIRATVREALGPRADEVLAGLEPTPVAVASIGQVHRARLPDGTPVAVKVRHPGIEQALAGDLATAGVGSLVAATLVPSGGGTVKAMIDEARAALMEECDYALEARRQARFGELLAGHPVLRVPRVVTELSRDAVLVTEWLPGLSLDRWLATAPSQAERDLAGAALFELYVGTLYRHGLFHADPHPGNYGFRPDPEGLTIAVYDFGCVRTFPPEVARAFRTLLAAVRADDARAMDDALRGMGARPDGDAATRAVQRTLLRMYYAPMLVDGPHRLTSTPAPGGRTLLEDKRAMMRLRLPGHVLFLFRLRFGLYAVLERLGAVVDWAALEAEWATAAPPG